MYGLQWENLQKGINSLLDTEELLSKEFSVNEERRPLEFHRTSTYYALWKCPKCHGEYHYPINKRYVGDDSCPYCNDNKVLAGLNSFKQKHPDLMKMWDYINNYLLCDPDMILDKASNKVWWKCQKCSKSYQMSPKRMIYFQKRNMVTCTYCKGLRIKKKYFF